MRRHAGLPPGVWAVRWVDLIQSTGDAVKTGVALVRLPNDTTAESISYMRPRTVGNLLRFGSPTKPRTQMRMTEGVRENLAFARVNFGSIPDFGVGTVFKDGSLLGTMALETKRFVIEGKAIDHEVLPAVHPAPFPPPAGWWPSKRQSEKNHGYKVLNPSAYALGSALAFSNCIPLRTRDGDLVLPCFEVFRALYAPATPIANALVKGRWNASWIELAVPGEGTGKLRDDDGWQITLQPKMSDEWAFLLSNLIIDPDGLRAAWSINHNLRFSKNALARLARRAPVHLVAPIPFGWSRLVLEVGVVRPYPGLNHYIGLQIKRAEWETPRKVVICREQVEKPNAVQPGDEGPQPNQMPEPQLADDDDVDVHDDNPSTRGEPVELPTMGVRWDNKPEMPRTKERKPVEGEGSGGATVKNIIEAQGGSTGFGRDNVIDFVQAVLSAHSDLDKYERFEQVVELLSQLKTSKVISAYREVLPPTMLVKVGRRRCWRLATKLSPNRSNWVVDRQAGFVRTAYVSAFDCEDAAGNSRTGYWIELAAHPTRTEPFHSLLFTLGDEGPGLQKVVKDLLNYIVQEHGVWHPSPKRRRSKRKEKAPKCDWPTEEYGAVSPQLLRHSQKVNATGLMMPGSDQLKKAVRAMFSGEKHH